MKRFLSLFLFSFSCVLLLTFVEALASWWGQTSGSWGLEELGEQLVKNTRLHANLEHKSQALRHSLEGKDLVTRELIAEKITLPEAVEHFRHLDQTREEVTGTFSPDCSDTEREQHLYSSVLAWVRVELQNRNPETRKQRWDSLQQQFHSQFNKPSGSTL
jgi:hypothetical protein